VTINLVAWGVSELKVKESIRIAGSGYMTGMAAKWNRS
jgi:hypothetical protein